MLGRAGFLLVVLALELIVISAISLLTGVAYHVWAYDDAGWVERYFALGGLTALAYSGQFLFRDEYRIHDFMEGRRGPRRVVAVWSYAFVFLGVVGFLTKSTEGFSRGWLVLFYVVGLMAVVMLSLLVRRGLGLLLAADRIQPKRVMLVGPKEELERASADADDYSSGVRVVATVELALGGGSTASEEGAVPPQDLANAVAMARVLHVDDVVIITDWSKIAAVLGIVDAFTVLPVSIHLGASSLIGRFKEARVSRFSTITALSLTAPPLGPLEAFAKRAVDVLASMLALILLSPLFAVVALLIKADGPGPVFFQQRRRGFNHEEFRIWKFRTMTTLDDGSEIVQARNGDSRVTRIGRYLRRLNIDELPQLINVIRGEMSLVGPRPHAVAHDRLYERRIDAYARRLNVRPGITGWAQVNGYRGITETDEAMRSRLQHDLYYIDNWSIWFDLYIILLTVVSPRSYLNAY